MASGTRRSSGPVVAVIGGGFSGLLTAIHLLREDSNLVVRLVERASHFGLGRAFATHNPDHLLNVRVANMSAFPDRPHHFADWLEARGADAGEGAFVSRSRYGDYLQNLLRDHIADPGNAGRLLLEQDEAVAIRPSGGGYEVRLALGRSLETAAVILAVGLGPPRLPRGISPDVLSRRTFVRDPWGGDLDQLPSGDILLLGSGLTMCDVALSLDRPDRQLLALSRHGLVPRTHGPAPAAEPPTGPLDTPIHAVRTLRTMAREVGWRSAVDSVRPSTTAVWQSWTERERRRFLRHLLPWWDVHRHRLSTIVEERMARAVWGERLAVLAGRLETLNEADGGFRATIRLRGRSIPIDRCYSAVVNCTGPTGDLRTWPLLDDLHTQGLARPDSLGLGLDVAADGALVAADGMIVRGLHAVGPLTRGRYWEAVAVPDLRVQAANVARTLVAHARRPASGRS